MKHQWRVISPQVDEPGNEAWPRRQIECWYCKEKRLVSVMIDPSTIPDRCPVRGLRRLWRRWFAAYLILAALLLSACNTAPQAGDVVDKDHRDGYYSYIPGCYNSKGVATCQIPTWNSEQWRIRLCADDICGWARVSESEYGQIEVGDFYDRR